MTDSEPPTETNAPACYLHPKRDALLRCSRCERPICGDDAIDAPVGYQCPECASGGEPVRRLADVARAAPLTRALVYVIGGLFVVTRAVPELTRMFGLRPVLLPPGGPELLASLVGWYDPSSLALAIGEPWLLVTSGFLHANLMHVGFNGLLLWQLGHLLEPLLGRSRFAALYLAGLAGGGLGVVLLSWVSTVLGVTDGILGNVLGGNPFQSTIGASGAVFGLMGAAMVQLRQRGFNPWRSSIGSLVLFNLAITFFVPGISVGGHLGGLLRGALAARLLAAPRDQAPKAAARTTAVAVGMLVLAVVLARAILSALTS